MHDITEEMMGTKQGREYIWHLLSITGFFASSYDEADSRHAMQSGVRSVGVHIWSDIQRMTPERVVEMLQENTNG